MVKKIFFAIGGGEMGRTKVLEDGSTKQCPVETMHIDKQIIKYSGKFNPNLLVVGTANKDDDGYYGVVEKHYSQRLNCNVSRLDITRNSYNKAQLEQIVFSADIIYISGGDTRYMLEEWKKSGLDQILIDAYNKGVIIAGCSAGAICWFDYYDNFDYRDEENFKPELLEGLGLFKGLAVPHYDKVSKEDRKVIKDLFNGKDGLFFNIENKEAVLFENKEFRYIHSLDKLLKDYHSYHHEILNPMIDELFNKLDDEEKEVKLYEIIGYNMILAHSIDYLYEVELTRKSLTKKELPRRQFIKSLDNMYSVDGANFANGKFEIIDAVNNSIKHSFLDKKRYNHLIDEYGDMTFNCLKEEKNTIMFKTGNEYYFDYVRVVLRGISELFNFIYDDEENIEFAYDIIDGKAEPCNGLLYEEDDVERMVSICRPRCLNCGRDDDCNCSHYTYKGESGEFISEVEFDANEFDDIMSRLSSCK